MKFGKGRWGLVSEFQRSLFDYLLHEQVINQASRADAGRDGLKHSGASLGLSHIFHLLNRVMTQKH